MFIDDLSLIDISLGIDGHALEIQNSQEILKSDILILNLFKIMVYSSNICVAVILVENLLTSI